MKIKNKDTLLNLLGCTLSKFKKVKSLAKDVKSRILVCYWLDVKLVQATIKNSMEGPQN